MSSRASFPYKGTPDAGPEGMVSPGGFEPPLPTPSTSCLLPLGYEDMEPLPRIERGPAAYEATALAD